MPLVINAAPHAVPQERARSEHEGTYGQHMLLRVRAIRRFSESRKKVTGLPGATIAEMSVYGLLFMLA